MYFIELVLLCTYKRTYIHTYVFMWVMRHPVLCVCVCVGGGGGGWMLQCIFTVLLYTMYENNCTYVRTYVCATCADFLLWGMAVYRDLV